MDLVCKNIFSSDIEYLGGTRTFILLSLIWIWSFLKGVIRSKRETGPAKLLLAMIVGISVSDLVTANGDIELSAVHHFLADEDIPGNVTPWKITMVD